MKKSLLALAVLGAFAGAASAQSSVTLYGKIDVGGVYDSGNVGGKSVRVSSGVSGGSRLGFKGVEDLGGGLKASFQIETGFCADTNAGVSNGYCTGGGSFMGRQAHVDLSGGFGTVSLGRQYNPVFLVVTTADPFGTGLAGSVGNLVDTAGVRSSNSVIYSTPSMGGFKVTAMGATGETTGNWKAGRQVALEGEYGAGPVWVGSTYMRVNDATGVADPTKYWNLGGTFDFGPAKVHGLFETVKHTSGGVTNLDKAEYMLGVSAPFGQSTVLASYTHLNDKTSANKDSSQYGVGYYYALSKRTSLYAAYAHISNKNGATYTVGNATDTGTGTSSTNLGIVHNF